MLSDDIKKLKREYWDYKKDIPGLFILLENIFDKVDQLQKDKQELAEALKEIDDYLSNNKLNYIGNNSILHMRAKRLKEKHYNKKWEDIK